MKMDYKRFNEIWDQFMKAVGSGDFTRFEKQLATIDRLTAENATLRDELRACEAARKAAVEALHFADDELEEQDIRLSDRCFIHCSDCDPSFGECWRTSYGCRKQSALAAAKGE